MVLRAVDPRIDSDFQQWFAILSRSEALHQPPGSGSWRPEDWRARALPADPSVVYALATFSDGDLPVAAIAIRLNRDDNQHFAETHLHVDPPFRRRGVGSAALAATEEMILRLGRTDVGAVAPEGPDNIDPRPSRFFAPRHGYVIGDEAIRRDIAWPMDQQHVAELRREWAAHASGYHFERWVGPASNRRAHQMADLIGRMPTETPYANHAFEAEQWDLARVRQHEQTVDEMGRDLLTTVAIETSSGEVVGYTELTVSRAEPGTAWQWDTFVASEHRGHRLGGLMKLANLDVFALRGYNTQRICTHNSSQNGPMIAVNEALGATITGSKVLWKKKLTS